MWELNLPWYPGWEPGTKEGQQINTKDISVKSGLSLVKMYQCWFIYCDRC